LHLANPSSGGQLSQVFHQASVDSQIQQAERKKIRHEERPGPVLTRTHFCRNVWCREERQQNDDDLTNNILDCVLNESAANIMFG
jgi:hypothetical protein